jgi:hypothetical protein
VVAIVTNRRWLDAFREMWFRRLAILLMFIKRGLVLRATLSPFTPVRRLNVDASLV